MNLEQAHFNMIEQQIRPCDVHDKTLLNILSHMGRDKFVEDNCKSLAYADIELPLPGVQTMLTPRIEALSIQHLDVHKKHTVLEIGSGSGFVTALLAKLADFVYSIEIDETNRKFALHNFTYAGINNVQIILGDGICGLADKAPFDRIFIGGGLTSVPQELLAQLKHGGKLVGFFGRKPLLYATLITRICDGDYTKTPLFAANPAYLIGEADKKFNF